MDIMRKNINGNEYIFYNSFRGNRSGFVHESELIRNMEVIGRNKVQYYNRTWERYTYQTVMKGLVRNIMDRTLEEYKIAWKNAYNVKRMTKQKHEAMMEDFRANTTEAYAELEELYNML